MENYICATCGVQYAATETPPEHCPICEDENNLTVNLPDEAIFQFDAGLNPQPGQKWDVSIDVAVAGQRIHVQTIEVVSGRAATELGFRFTMTADFPVMGAMIHDANPISSNSGAAIM